MTKISTSTNSSAGVAIRIDHVRRVFENGLEGVADVSLQIEAGDFLAFLGPSGCGKSTLLRTIAGLDVPTAGSIFMGDSLSNAIQKPSAIRIAYVFQDAQLLPWRTVLRNVSLPLELQGVDRSERLDRATEAIRQVGLADAIRRYPAQLSGGMRMRVSLARALVTEPALLLLDEPFAALDELTRQRLDEQLRDLWLRRRMTVLFVTHSISEAAFLSNRAIVFTTRPAKVVLDYKIDLPEERHVALRTEDYFVKQTRAMHDALVRGGA